jgi:TPR repeat protein
MSLPPASILSVPIYDFAIANEELADEGLAQYYQCCGKSICRGCLYSLCVSGNEEKCPFCNSDRGNKTAEELVEEVRKRVEANDAASISMLANSYDDGLNGIQQDHTKAKELYAKAADLGHSEAHSQLANIYLEQGNLKKAKFHYEAAAMAGHEGARNNLGCMEAESRNMDRAAKHLTIAASTGDFQSMQYLRLCFEKGLVSRESIDLTLEAYNNSCTEMRSEDRDAYIRTILKQYES